ncbi:hypothetical protein B9G79_03515 [Bdellovibrio bacteriovorus]|uniref:Uncharacterized protein n=1 Tax=Bdellovibrio bacteriovorus TaxID=959 RepID=A0A1Z3N5D9_BDEBC|nr:hypothetical protein B9G79_03515 [Bdellovibrio bacteriovorus]
MKPLRNKAKNPDKKMTQPDATRRVKRQYFLAPKPRRRPPTAQTVRTVNNAGMSTKGDFQVFYPNKPGKRHWGEGGRLYWGLRPRDGREASAGRGQEPVPQESLPPSPQGRLLKFTSGKNGKPPLVVIPKGAYDAAY